MPPDIERYIDAHFGQADRERVRSALVGLRERLEVDGDRILRCVLQLSGSDPVQVERNVQQALLDWRDVIMWAEYDRTGAWLRDLTKPFDSK